VIELVLELGEPPAAHAWSKEQLGLDVVFYCDAPGMAALDDFRTLGRGEWTFGGERLWHRFGVRPPVEAPEIWRSPVCKLLGRLQPPCADRFLRVPVQTIATCKEKQVRFRVRIGAEARTLLESLRGAVRLNCVPLWNAALGSVERVVNDARVPEVDPAPLRTSHDRIVILECLDRRTGRTWCDRRFAGGRDLAETFTIAQSPHKAHAAMVLFDTAPPPADWRILYLAGLEEFQGVAPGTWVASQTGEHFVVRSGICVADEVSATLVAECPAGRVVTETDLIELLWRIAPAPVRQRIDTEAIDRYGEAVVDVRQELQVVAGNGGEEGRRASPVTIVTLPRRGEAAGEDLDYWLEAMARDAERHGSFGEKIEVRCEPFSKGGPS
jgi:hypothetical protein